MRQNLLRVNELIYDIESKFDNPKKLQSSCTQLLDLLQYLDEQTSYHYHLFLAQIYATKLGDFKTAQKICRNVMKDKQRVNVQIQALLRLSLINSLQYDYNKATKFLEQASTLSQQKPQFQLVFINFCTRLFNYSKQCNLLYGLKYQNQENYAKAMEYYIAQFQKQVNNDRIQNKYFATKSIQFLISTSPNNEFKGINCKKYENYIAQLMEQQQERRQFNYMDHVNENYKNYKRYLKKIVQLYATKLKFMQNLGKSDKRLQIKFQKELKLKKLLAYIKITLIIKNKRNLDPQVKQQFQKCLFQLRTNRYTNYSALNQFTNTQANICKKALLRLKKIYWRQFKNRLRGSNNIIKKASSIHDPDNVINPGYNRGTANHFSTFGPQSMIQDTEVIINQKQRQSAMILQNQKTKNKSNIYNQGYGNPSKISLQDQFRNSPQFKSFAHQSSNPMKQQSYNLKNKSNEHIFEQYQSQVLYDQVFQGSQMVKINQNSDGYQSRFFYFVPKQLREGKFKLYYNEKAQKRNKENDNYYDIKNMKQIIQGKQTKALQRKQCAKLQPNKCFTIVLKDRNRSFYVQDYKCYQKWVKVIKKYLKDQKISKYGSSNMTPQKSNHMSKTYGRKTIIL